MIPAYNCEKYIAKCLDSLLNQDYPERNYEIIITDDGSTDQAGKICDTYAERFPFIHVTHTENKGPSNARNVALAQTSGKYVFFCDADDFVSPQLVSVLVKAFEIHDNPDVLVWNYFSGKFPKKGWPVYDVQNMKASEAKFVTGEELCRDMAPLRERTGRALWNKLIKRAFADGLRFDDSLTVCQDVYWQLVFFSRHKNLRICCLNYYLYCYVKHDELYSSRNPRRKFLPNGISKHILGYEKVLAIENLPERAAEQVKGHIYTTSIGCLFKNEVKIQRDAYQKLRQYMKDYARIYYLKSLDPITLKISALIAHILVLLHIHK